MQAVSGVAGATRSVRPVLRAAWRGLVQVLIGSDPALGWRWRSPWQRRAARAALAVGTLLLCLASVGSLNDGHALLPGAKSGRHRVTLLVPSLFRVRVPPTRFAFLPGGQMALILLVALAVVAPLGLAGRYPLLGWRIGWLGLLLVPLLEVSWWGGLPWDPVQILVLVAVLCAAAVRHERAVLGWMWALTLVPCWLWAGRNGLSVVTAMLASIAFLALAVAVDSAGSRRRAQLALSDQAEQTELEQARRAVLEERARIARELHDVVAHHLSLIAVRAESAPYRLAGLPEPVRAEFGSLSGAAREALADMRRLLGVLRSDQPRGTQQPGPLAPQPALADLPGLIDSARRAGMAVQLSAPPALDRVPSSTGVCAYRIVQEALSNAGRHAAGALVAVSVCQQADAVVLRVANGPGVPAGPPASGQGPGHGLTGMRERVELLGGSLSAGPAPDGGFLVSAVLPVAGRAA